MPSKSAPEKARDRILRYLDQMTEEQRLAVLAEACRMRGYFAEARELLLRLAAAIGGPEVH